MKQLLVFYWIAAFFFLFDKSYAQTYSMTRYNTIPTMSTNCMNWMNCHLNKCTLHALWGTPAPELRMYLGLWSYHTANNDKRNGHNNMFGFCYKSYFLGTLENSYYKRAYAIGIQRYWFMRPLSNNMNYELGYRLGLVTGYQGHSVSGVRALKNSPIIPFVQLVLGLNYKNVGCELSTPNFSVISAGFYIRF